MIQVIFIEPADKKLSLLHLSDNKTSALDDLVDDWVWGSLQGYPGEKFFFYGDQNNPKKRVPGVPYYTIGKKRYIGEGVIARFADWGVLGSSTLTVAQAKELVSFE